MLITRVLASFVTLTSMSMAAVASWDRGGSMADRVLLVSLSLAIIAAVHFLPAVSRRPVSWFLWFGCVLCAIYGHMVFFANASMRAGDVRAEGSRDLAGVERQIQETKDALAAIKARPISQIATELAVEKAWRTRSALKTELAEATRAQKLRDDLISLESNARVTGVTAATDPVTAQISSVLGRSSASIMLIIGLTFSILLELVGALMWYEVLRGDGKNTGVPAPSTGVLDQTSTGVLAASTGVSEASTAVAGSPAEMVEVVALDEIAETGNVLPHQLSLEITAVANIEAEALVVDDEQDADETIRSQEFEKVKIAVASGQCELSIRGIRKYLNCGQTRARKFRDRIKEVEQLSPAVA